MAVTTALVVGAAASAYGAYGSRQTGKEMTGIARGQAGRQEYFANQLIDLMQNPSKIFEDPGYQESFAQGTQAVERSNAARGFTGSGNAAIALQKFGQSFSSDYLRQQQNLLASLSGAQFNPIAGYQAGQGAQNDAYSQLGNTLAGLGYAFGGAGASGGGGGAAAGAVGSSYGSYGTALPPGTMAGGGGYIVNIPGGDFEGYGTP